MSDVDAPEPAAEAAPEPETDHGVLVSWSRGQKVLHPTLDAYLPLVTALHDEGYLVCTDLTVVDFLTYDSARTLPDGIDPERFEVVVGVHNHATRSRLRIRLQVPAGNPVVPSLFGVHHGSEAMEREAYDMFGISFDGHPDLTRILMPEDWVGHPLRKDESSGRIPVQFKDAPTAR